MTTHLAVAGLALGGCAVSSDRDESGRLTVVATVSPVTNLVQNIGGDRIRLTGLVPEGADSHTYEPAPSAARVLGDADVVFFNGLHLEDPTLELARANVPASTEIVLLGDRALTPDEYIFDSTFPEAGGDPNPHVWTSPRLALRYADLIEQTLVSADPAGAAYYRSNHDQLVRRLKHLDRAARIVTETVPRSARRLLTYHDSFPYFARDYGWDVVGAIQPSDFSDPTPADVARLIDQIEALGVPAIFGSEVFPSPVLEQIASESGAVYIDDLRDDDLPGQPGERSHSYLGLMVHDFKTFMGALGGDTSALERISVANIAGNAATEYRP